MGLVERDIDDPVVLIPLHPPVLASVSRDGSWRRYATISCARDATIRQVGDALVVHEPTTARIDVFRIGATGLTHERTVGAPPATRICDLAVDEHRIFVGGSTEHAAALLFATRDDDTPWTALSLPESLAISGKAIDGLFVDGDRRRLVALDDIVFPHAMLRFDLRDAHTTPRLLDEVELPGRTYEEHAPGIVANDRWLAIRSTSVGMGGAAAFVDLLDRETLAPTATVYRGREWDGTERDVAFRGIGFVGTKLVIAGGEEGVGVIDTKGMRRRTRPFSWHEETREVTKRVEWRAMPAGRAVDLVPVPQWGGAIIVIETPTGRVTEWLAV